MLRLFVNVIAFYYLLQTIKTTNFRFLTLQVFPPSRARFGSCRTKTARRMGETDHCEEEIAHDYDTVKQQEKLIDPKDTEEKGEQTTHNPMIMEYLHKISLSLVTLPLSLCKYVAA